MMLGPQERLTSVGNSGASSTVDGGTSEPQERGVLEAGTPRYGVAFLCSLFPTMPRHNFWKVTPLVKSLCTKYGIEYQSKPLLTAFADIV